MDRTSAAAKKRIADAKTQAEKEHAKLGHKGTCMEKGIVQECQVGGMVRFDFPCTYSKGFPEL